jgi:hypothetical protein
MAISEDFAAFYGITTSISRSKPLMDPIPGSHGKALR